MSTVVRSLLTVMEDMANALAPLSYEIPGLQVVPYLNINPTPPTVDIYPSAPFQEATEGGFGVTAVRFHFTVRARVTTADQQAGQVLLLRMMDPSDPMSLEVALLDARVDTEGVSEYREYVDDGLLGCEWRVSTFL